VGSIHKIIIVGAPTTFFVLWKLFKPFASRRTTDKMHFVNTTAEKERVIGSLYDSDQLAPWMLPTGTKTRDLDLDEYMRRTPFDRAFDDQRDTMSGELN
jgi:CRAL/TRIO domain